MVPKVKQKGNPELGYDQLEILLKEDACFAAGTLVHTDKGLVPIQDIKVGDEGAVQARRWHW